MPMKKLLLLISSLCVFGAKAQSFEVYDGSSGTIITNNQIISEDITAGGNTHLYIYVKNTSANNVSYGIKRVDQAINPGASAYFCFGSLGTCFPPSTTSVSATDYLNVNAGASSSNQQLYFDEDLSTQGYSEIVYELYNVNNPSDKFTFTLKYNSILAGIKENHSLFGNISNVFPNPSNHVAHIKLQSSATVKNAVVGITNSLGTEVYSNNITLNVGDNTVRLETENLPSGIYFATITSGKNKIVKKFIVNK